MSVVITQKGDLDLSKKAQSLTDLAGRGLSVPTTLVIPMYMEGDFIPLHDLGHAQRYYMRLCFRDASIKKRVGKIVSKEDVSQYAIELANIAASDAADLIIQPLLNPLYSGAVLKLGDSVFIESAFGLAPTLFHKGRFSYRAILSDQKLVCAETVSQGMALILKDGAIIKVEDSGLDKYDPQASFFQIAEMLAGVNNILLEWSVVNGSIVYFDHKDVVSSFCFLQLRESPPKIPRYVTASLDEVEKPSVLGRVCFLDYPDLDYLPQARASDYVVISHGALLSHLSAYSIYESYKCVFR